MTRATTDSTADVPRVDFVAEDDRCGSCGDRLRIQKSRTRVVMTLALGTMRAREVLKHCGNDGCAVVGSRALCEIVKPRQRYGWDLVVHVGLARYLRGMQRGEIRAELESAHGLELSDGTVSNLCDRFLAALEALHLQRVPALREAMEDGYALHLDATSDRGKGGLFVCMDGLRGWVLLAARITSENGKTLSPLVERTVSLFGDPIATVRDLGEAGGKAVEALRERGIPDLLCHYHFLSAVGKKLFDKPYGRLRNRLRALGVTRDLWDMLRDLRGYRHGEDHRGRFGTGQVREELLALVLWLLEGDGSKKPTYPFALVWWDLVQRIRNVVQQADAWVPRPRTAPERSSLRFLARLASKLAKDRFLVTTAQQLHESWLPFSELRDVLRLAPVDLPRVHATHQAELPELELFRRRQIDDALAKHGLDLRQQLATVGKKSSRFSPQAVIINYLDRYGSQLVDHPVIRDTNGHLLAVVERTNNIAEHFFGRTKHRLRRRVGRVALGRDMELQPAQTALVPNLQHADYVRLLCGSIENLPAAFAEIHSNPRASVPAIVRTNRDAHLVRCLRSLLLHRGDDSATPTTKPPLSDSPAIAAIAS